MSSERRVAFFKALIAAAWADGEINPAEVRTLTDYLRVFRLSEEEVDQLRQCLTRPLSPAAARELLEQQLQHLATADEQGALVAAIKDVLLADDELQADEAQFLRHLKQLTGAAASPDVFLAQLRGIWSQPSAPPAAAKAPAGHPRENLLESFFQRRVLEVLRRRLALARATSAYATADITDADLLRVAIWAGLLARVAHADAAFCPAQRAELLAVLRQDESIPEPDLRVIVETYADPSLVSTNLSTLVQKFRELVAEEQLPSLLDSLFLVASADGTIDRRELAVVGRIAREAGFPEAAFREAYRRCQRRLENGWN